MARNVFENTLRLLTTWLFHFAFKLWTCVLVLAYHGVVTMARDSGLADMKRLDQGNHECEVLEEGAEGAREWEKCVKNPRHERFIPAPDFTINHLPEEYQDQQFFEYIKYMIDLTVKVRVMYTSADRPNGYPFSKFGGQTISHIGSGCVRHAGVPYERKVLKESCPCIHCEKSGKPEAMWWECNVITAKHVVFNTEEARHAIIEVFHDDKSRDRVKYLYGIKVMEESTDGDRCELKCVTHDEAVVEQLRHAEETSLSIHRTFSRERYPTLGKEKANLCVVVSHPHGCSKHVTLGHWTNCLKQGEDTVLDEHTSSPWYETHIAYTYDTPTCPGSSGGCTIILGLWDPRWKYILAAYYFCHTHSSGQIVNGQNANTSCYWLVAAQ